MIKASFPNLPKLRWLPVALVAALLCGQWAQVAHTHTDLHADTTAACDLCAHADRNDCAADPAANVSFEQRSPVDIIRIPATPPIRATQSRLPPSRAPPTSGVHS